MTATRATRGRLVVAALVLALSPGGAQAGDVLLRVRQGTDISAAPLGEGRLVLDLAGRLWTLPAAGGTATPLSPDGDYARRPAVSPDGRTLAFETLREGGHQVMLMDADGGSRSPPTAAGTSRSGNSRSRPARCGS